jgi:hypothetical protein
MHTNEAEPDGNSCESVKLVGEPSLPGNRKHKGKSFCAIPPSLTVLKGCIVFARKDEELNQCILRQQRLTETVRGTFGKQAIGGQFQFSSGLSFDCLRTFVRGNGTR